MRFLPCDFPPHHALNCNKHMSMSMSVSVEEKRYSTSTVQFETSALLASRLS